MAPKYTDYTKVGKAYQKKTVSYFATDWIRPTNTELTNGIVIGYLPPGSLVQDSGCIKKGTDTLAPETKIQVNGAQIQNKYYADGGIIEVKGAETLSVDVRYVIEFAELDLATGNWIPTQQEVLSHDGQPTVLPGEQE